MGTYKCNRSGPFWRQGTVSPSAQYGGVRLDPGMLHQAVLLPAPR
jgi:hypothetical protein